MDGIALDSAELALVLLAEHLPAWSLRWSTEIGMWEVLNPKGLVRASDRSPFDAVTTALTRLSSLQAAA